MTVKEAPGKSGLTRGSCRGAVSGRFVTAKHGKANPKTTLREKRPPNSASCPIPSGNISVRPGGEHLIIRSHFRNGGPEVKSGIWRIGPKPPKSGKPASSPSICLSRVRFDMTNAVFAAIIAVNFARFTLKRISLVPLMF